MNVKIIEMTTETIRKRKGVTTTIRRSFDEETGLRFIYVIREFVDDEGSYCRFSKAADNMRKLMAKHNRKLST